MPAIEMSASYNASILRLLSPFILCTVRVTTAGLVVISKAMKGYFK